MCGGESGWALGCAVIQETTLSLVKAKSGFADSQPHRHSVVHLGKSQHLPRTSPNGDSNICLTEELVIVCKVLKSNSLKELNSSFISTSKKHNTNIGFWWQFYQNQRAAEGWI